MITKKKLVSILRDYNIEVNHKTTKEIMRQLIGVEKPIKKDFIRKTHRPDLTIEEQIIFLCENKMTTLFQKQKTTIRDFGIVDDYIDDVRQYAIEELLAMTQLSTLSRPWMKLFEKETVKKFFEAKSLCDLPLMFTNFRLLGKGSYGVVFYGCIEWKAECNYPVAIKITGYTKNPEEVYESLPIDNKRRPENVEWEVRRIIFEELKKVQTVPHIPWPFLTFLCDTSDVNFLEVLLKKAKFNIKAFHPQYRVFITEFVDMGDLEDYFDKNREGDKTDELLYIMFQVFMSLAQIQAVHSTYIHNDLHTGNVLLRSFPKGKIIKYSFNQKVYELQSRGFIAMINDFDFSEVRNEIRNAKTEDFFGTRRVLLGYTDIYRFVSALYDLVVTDLQLKMTNRCRKFMAELSLADRRMDFDRIKIQDKTRKEEKVSEKIDDVFKFFPSKLVDKTIFQSFVARN